MPLSVRKNPHRLIKGLCCCHFFSTVFDWILLILAGNNDICKSMDEFEILPDLTTDYRRRSNFGQIHFFSVAIDLICILFKLA